MIRPAYVLGNLKTTVNGSARKKFGATKGSLIFCVLVTKCLKTR